MRKLLNTLYIMSSDLYLAQEGETVVVKKDGETLKRLPLRNFESIATQGYQGVSPGLMRKCSEYGIPIVILSRSGRVLSRITGPIKGNVLLRRNQYRLADDPLQALRYAKLMTLGKIYNQKWLIERMKRDHSLTLNCETLSHATDKLGETINALDDCMSAGELRGIEGAAAQMYFSVYDEMIVRQKDDFKFINRERRPPIDPVNAILSYLYTILNNDCAAALETVGLDPYVGFLHTDRSGRTGLALDLSEEFRSIMVDRLVLTAINTQQIRQRHFEHKENGAVLLTDEGKKVVLGLWQKRKNEIVMHPFLNEKIQMGLFPYVQSLLLARTIRGDLDKYPPLLYRV